MVVFREIQVGRIYLVLAKNNRRTHLFWCHKLSLHNIYIYIQTYVYMYWYMFADVHFPCNATQIPVQ